MRDLFEPPKITPQPTRVVSLLGDEPAGAWNNLMRIESLAKARAARSLAHLAPSERKQRRREQLQRAKERYLDKQKEVA